MIEKKTAPLAAKRDAYVKMMLALTVIAAAAAISIVLADDSSADGFSVGGINYEITSGDSVMVIDGAYFGSVVIPSSVEYESIQYDVKSIRSDAFNYLKYLDSVTIPDSVASIYSNTFTYSSVSRINIGSGVTYINQNAFTGCTDLKEFVVSESNTSYRSADGVLFTNDGTTLVRYPAAKIGTSYSVPDGVTALYDSAFNKNIFLRSVSLPNSLTNIGGYVFDGCANLSCINIPAGVTNIGDAAFRNCSSLVSVDIPDGVSTIYSSVFKGCASLRSLMIGSGVTDIWSPSFCGCTSLTAFEVASGNTAFCAVDGILYSKDMTRLVSYPADRDVTSYTIPGTVSSIDTRAFDSCRKLVSLTIPGSIAYIPSFAFDSCASLSEVTIQEGVTEIKYNAFDGCASLRTVSIPASLTAIGSEAFCDCTSMTSYSVAEGSASFCSPNGILFSKDMTHLYAYPAAKTDGTYAIPASVQYIEDYAFSGCRSLTSVTLPDGIKEIKGYAFGQCTGLSSIAFPDGIQRIASSAFSRCTSLTVVDIPAGVNMDSYAFIGCTGLTAINVAAGNASCRSIDGVLYGPSGNIIYQYPASKADTEYNIPLGVEAIDSNAFYKCSRLRVITIPSSVSIIYSEGFHGTSSLTAINVDDGNTKYCSVDGVLYTKDMKTICQYPAGKSGGSFTIPASVTTIDDIAFQACTSLTEIRSDNTDIFSNVNGALLSKDGTRLYLCPQGVKEFTVPGTVKTMAANSVYGKSIEKLTIPESVDAVYQYSIVATKNLKEIVILNKDVSFSVDSIYSDGNGSDRIVIRAPEGFRLPELSSSKTITLEYKPLNDGNGGSGGNNNALLIGGGVAAVIVIAIAAFLIFGRGKKL